ncbi:hypothetical protein ES705_33292 [subsurface metagenome]
MAEPTCTTEAPHTIGKTYATLTGVLVDDGGHACVYRFWYMAYKSRTWHTTPWGSCGAPGSTFSAVITPASVVNNYDYFAQVANEDGQDDGLTLRFWFRWASPPHDGSPFLVLDVTIVGPWSTWIITMTTDISCHLTLHVDNNVPFRRKGEHFKRGVVYMHTPLTYFTPKWHLEQQETGDSRVHTFLWSCPKPYGRYTIQATGTNDGRLSPSKSPFFYFACKPEPPPVETSDQCIWARSNTGYFRSWNAGSQTFRPDHPYPLHTIAIRINQYSLERKGYVAIKLTRAGGACWSEHVIWSTEEWSRNLPSPGSKTWSFFRVGSIPLEAGVTYRILVHTVRDWYYYTNGDWKRDDGKAAMRCWTSDTLHDYPRGTCWYYCNIRDSSGEWRDYGVDMNFICYEVTPG